MCAINHIRPLADIYCTLLSQLLHKSILSSTDNYWNPFVLLSHFSVLSSFNRRFLLYPSPSTVTGCTPLPQQTSAVSISLNRHPLYPFPSTVISCIPLPQQTSDVPLSLNRHLLYPSPSTEICCIHLPQQTSVPLSLNRHLLYPSPSTKICCIHLPTDIGCIPLPQQTFAVPFLDHSLRLKHPPSTSLAWMSVALSWSSLASLRSLSTPSLSDAISVLPFCTRAVVCFSSSSSVFRSLLLSVRLCLQSQQNQTWPGPQPAFAVRHLNPQSVEQKTATTEDKITEF